MKNKQGTMMISFLERWWFGWGTDASSLVLVFRFGNKGLWDVILFCDFMGCIDLRIKDLVFYFDE